VNAKGLTRHTGVVQGCSTGLCLNLCLPASPNAQIRIRVLCCKCAFAWGSDSVGASYIGIFSALFFEHGRNVISARREAQYWKVAGREEHREPHRGRKAGLSGAEECLPYLRETSGEIPRANRGNWRSYPMGNSNRRIRSEPSKSLSLRPLPLNSHFAKFCASI
jgi:hypothetical protein